MHGVVHGPDADIALTYVYDVQGNQLRPGGEYFTRPAGAGQRRYEAMRAYFVEDASAAEIADRFGYSTASVHQMATLLRTGKLAPFVEAKPGPKGPRKATAAVREKVLALRAGGRSVGEIAAALAEAGTPISAQTVWQILAAAGLPRLDRRDETRRGSPAILDPVKAAAQPHWPAGTTIDCGHAGLLLLVPAMVEVGLHELVADAGYPGTSAITAWQSIATLLLAKCARRHRAHHIDALTDDAGLAHALGLTALPKATHAGSYSYRVRRESNQKLLTGLVTKLRPLGMASGTEGFNLDFHAIRHHGEDTVLEKHYVPRRSQRTRAVLTFFAQDHASTEMVYANAELTKAEQAREILAFADYWHAATGEDPGLLVFDSQLTTYTVLNQLSARAIGWLTLRKRGKTEIDRLHALPANRWKSVTITRSGRHRRPQLHEDMIKLKDLDTPVRQIAVRNIGRDEPTLLITNDLTTPAKDLFARYAERMLIENELDAYISGFHLDALSSGLPLNIDLDTALTVVAGNLYRLFARNLTRYETATPDTLWRHFLDDDGTLHITDQGVTCALRLRSHHPQLIDAGYADLNTPIPWWNNRTLQFTFPPR
jgi:transposase